MLIVGDYQCKYSNLKNKQTKKQADDENTANEEREICIIANKAFLNRIYKYVHFIAN